MYGSGCTYGFLFIRIFRYQHLCHIVYILKGHGCVKIRVRFSIHRSHQLFFFLFGETFFFLYYIIRTDFLILLYRLFCHRFGTCRSFSRHFRVFEIDNFCLADYIFSNSRRRLCRLPVLCVGLFPALCLFIGLTRFLFRTFLPVFP